MAFSFTQHIGDGNTKSYLFSFTGIDEGYLRENDIVVTVDGIVTTDFIFASSNQITFNTAPALNAIIQIRRVMPKDEPYTDFIKGNAFGAKNVNYSFLQQLYALHEMMDGFKDDGYYEKQDLSMGTTNQIKDMADGTEDQDAVTLKQLNEVAAIPDLYNRKWILD